ncbi:DJ-1 protein-PfpI domain-containing protein [Mycena indigotica]|uniref:DJ-1 protein-PfpI domain-containing protein n=1 Tax=Mycena indigotica TaxID=2126181 RepID=A0A8H6VWI1_9AGAR|nr:DJ-1 protein-PfpI domain-containing protein [Mycena indigotica]KAF7292728.1 DJ-1 protein-PfpI domain-containing protein [Mycena indigotica]
MSTATLHLAVCISEEVTLSDFVQPIEILAAGFQTAATTSPSTTSGYSPPVPFKVVFDYLAPTMDPVVSAFGPSMATLNPTKTYAQVTESGMQYDIIWVPAGPPPHGGIDRTPPEEIEFIRAQAPGAKYILSVCSGALQLALAGVLSGKKATTNKAFYRVITETATTASDIDWQPRARWVVDGNVWTSSGVAAGSDMALAFLEHLAGAKLARQVRGLVEIPEVSSFDDPFAEFHGLV